MKDPENTVTITLGDQASTWVVFGLELLIELQESTGVDFGRATEEIKKFKTAIEYAHAAAFPTDAWGAATAEEGTA